ncbi:MAG: hypothetical protein N4A74_02345, partial [Carboxylicivirga sp.]|nr:hypothetical protein [Carboxylicivirga sp.]
MESKKKILVENTLWVYLAKILVQAFGFIASVMVLRQLPVDVYGTYFFLFGLFTLYQLLITSPLRHVILRFIPELVSKLSKEAILKLFSVYFVTALLMIVLLTALLWGMRASFSSFFNIPDSDQYLTVFMVFVLCYALKILTEIVLSALIQHRLMALLNIGVVIIRTLAYFILLKQLTVQLLLLIEAGLSLFFFATALLGAQRLKVSDGEQKVISQGDKKRMKRFWLYSIFTELGAGIIGRTSDLYIVAAMSNPFAIGIYGLAVKIYEIVYKLMPLKEFESVLKPVFFGRFTKDSSEDELNAFYNFNVKVMLPVMIFPALYFLLFGQSLIFYVFGEKYMDAYWVCVLVLSTLIIDGFFYPLIFMIQLKERLEVVMISRFVVFLSLGLGIYLMKQFGVMGVALATFIGEFVKNTLMYLLFKRHCKLIYDYRIWSSNLLLIFSGIVVFGLVS